MARLIHRRLAGVAPAAMLAAGAGCAGDGPVPVTGKVTVDGSPLGGAGITFTPAGGGKRAAHGETKDDGTYTLSTFQPGDGALRGGYVVTIVWEEQPHPYLQTRPGSQAQEDLKADYLKWKATHKPKPSPVPAGYGDPAKSPLRQKVPAPGGVADLALSGKGP